MIESIRLLDAIADFWKSSNPPRSWSLSTTFKSGNMCLHSFSHSFIYIRFRKPQRMAVRQISSNLQSVFHERFCTPLRTKPIRLIRFRAIRGSFKLHEYFIIPPISATGFLIVGGSLPPLPRYSIWWISNNPDVIDEAVENRVYRICSETHRNSLIPEDLKMPQASGV